MTMLFNICTCILRLFPLLHRAPVTTCSVHARAAKGRTNVELREQFTLAEGVSQSMATFKSKSPAVGGSGRSPTSSAASTWSGQSSSSASGPIIKVREAANHRAAPADQSSRYVERPIIEQRQWINHQSTVFHRVAIGILTYFFV